jgi:hypothetical protein
VSVRDVLVQIGFLMVSAGVMLAVWAVVSGQFRRGEPATFEDEAREPEPEPEPASVPRRTDAPPRATRARTTRRAKAKPAAPARRPRPRKPRPPA